VTPDLRRKALAVLREARLTILHAECRKTAQDVDEVIARVRSSREGGPSYCVDFLDGVWTCTCRDGGGCAHVAAVQIVTGHATAAVPA
jgi:hypothetical protein